MCQVEEQLARGGLMLQLYRRYVDDTLVRMPNTDAAVYRHRNDPHHRDDPRYRNDPQSPPKCIPTTEMIPAVTAEMIP